LEAPLVSVVVSCYNRPVMLNAALQSVLSQTMRNLEVVVQDDSTDLSCEDLVSGIDDERIRYTHNRPPLGTGRNLIAGYWKCRGKYFSTLNDDDLYDPEYLELMLAAMEANPSYSLAFSDHSIIDEKGAVLEAETTLNSVCFGRAVLEHGSVPGPIRCGLIDKCVPGMFAVFRAEAMDLKDFPEEVSSAYDYWLTYLAVRNGGAAFYEPRRLTSYRVHQGSQTSSFSGPEERSRFLQYNEFIDRRFLSDERLRSIWPDVRRRLAETLASEGFASLRLQHRNQAIRELLASLGMQFTLKAMAGILLTATPEPLRRSLLTRRAS
jgi:glycosyltransferase involved in cell wall biosynthesis